ncbi:Sphingomyelin phosphodiesterase-like protein [Globisporangium polare]
MGVLEVVRRIRQRVLVEMLDLDPIAEPPAPRADWPQWTNNDGGGDDSGKDVKIRVLSFNAWGLPVAPKVTERAVEIANAIEGDFEIVVLQEIWHRRERNLIISRAEQAGFHFYHYFNPAIGFPVPLGHDSFGTGLLVLSKFPIVGVLYHSFALSGRPYALHEADFVANKGAGLLRVQTPAGQIDLYVTHLLANYNALGAPGPGDRYLPHRTGQSYELARFIAATNKNELTIVCGDFNSPSDSIELRIPKELVHLRDAFTDMNSHDGLTFATEDNKYSFGDHPMRMDYVLYKTLKQQSQTQSSTKKKDERSWQLVGSDVFKGFFTDERGEKTPLSDHFGVKAEFVFGAHRPQPCEELSGGEMDATSSSSSGLSSEGGDDARSCLTTTCVHCDEVEGTKYLANSFPHSVKVLQEVQQLILQGRARAIMRRSGHLRRSGLSFLAVLFIIVARLVYLNTSLWSWLAIMGLTIVGLSEYILAFFFVTLECSTFTELANQVRLHLHAEQANIAVL